MISASPPPASAPGAGLLEAFLAGSSLAGSFFAGSRHVAVARVDPPSGSVRACNAALVAILRRSVEEVVGTPLQDHLTTPDGDRLARWCASAGVGQAEPIRLNLVDVDGAPQTLDGWVGRTDDEVVFVGERAEAEERALQEELLHLNNELAVLSRENARKSRQLARALEELEEAQAMLVHQEKMASLGVMTAGVAHEINNPLAYVLGNQQTLRRDFDDLLGLIDLVAGSEEAFARQAPELHEAIVERREEIDLDHLLQAIPRKIAASAEGLERIKEIVLDLRTFSRLDEAEQKAASLADGVRAAVRFLGPLQSEHDVSIETDLPALPPIVCAPGAINQVLVNLLVNAVQASRRGQSVRVSTREDGDGQILEVGDDGAGIPPEDLPRVFDPFFTTKPVGSGTGLGLSIAHRVVAAHGGTIEIDSEVGVGTRVRVRLPRSSGETA